MSGREWKPGDVAMVRNEHGVWNVAILQVDLPDWMWQYGVSRSSIPVGAEARPLVVIDPENREQVERLTDAYEDERPGSTGLTKHMQAALRSLVTPPKPDEPQGLGAVVEDAEGQLWVRVEPEPASVTAWNPTWTDRTDEKQPADWPDIAAVKVLSEGVTP